MHIATFKVEDPILPRKRRCPNRLDDGTAVGDHPETPKALFQQHYFEALDLIIRSRFEQPGYNTYKNLQELLFKSIKGQNFESELEYVSQFYGDDVQKDNLRSQLHTFALDYPSKNTSSSIFDIREYITSISPAKKQLIAEVCTVFNSDACY